jgi:hypothetical protein
VLLFEGDGCDGGGGGGGTYDTVAALV